MGRGNMGRRNEESAMFNPSRRKFGAALAAATLAGLGTALAPGSARAAYKLFGSNEISSTKLEKFQKWTGALERYAEEAPSELEACTPTPTDNCHVARWRIFLNSIANETPGIQLQKVNAYLNQYAYILDPVNYGKKDYWATPRQFMYRTGDCEDYAISKYVSLIHLGWPKEDMRIVVLQDLNLGIPHAILVVYVQGKAYVLDNQIPQVIEANRIKHYKPIFSINDGRWWLHRT
jgi:predicted transglutaminase-like cysteine proteinase